MHEYRYSRSPGRLQEQARQMEEAMRLRRKLEEVCYGHQFANVERRCSCGITEIEYENMTQADRWFARFDWHSKHNPNEE